ncbi:MAG: lysophospholipid acyltransferase family protein [Candidatus Omnitrophota bacterium]|nr:lysophospholipid acyltransferase family protein [Candidatus Omnitrophota bacterium]
MNKNSSRRHYQELSIQGLRILQWIVRRLPRWCGRLSMQILFPLAYWGMRDLRQICTLNMQRVYATTKTRQDIAGMTHACLKTIATSMMDLIYFVDRPEKLAKIVHLHNEEHLQNALNVGKGVIGATAHLGNFPLLFVALARKGYKVNVIIRPMRDEQFSQFVHDLCAQWNINMITTFPRKEFVRETLGALRRNELLFILLDEVIAPSAGGVEVDFFNGTVTRAPGPMIFHERMGSPVLPIFITQDERGNFNIFIEPALDVEARLAPDENTRRNIARLTATIEKFVTQYPCQWGGWFNKKWLQQQTIQSS